MYLCLVGVSCVIFFDNFCYYLIRTSNSDSVYCMPSRILNKSGSILTGRNSATMSPQLPYLQFLFVALLLLQILLTSQGIARRLVKAAMQEAAKKREMRYSDLKKIDRGVRRHFHDDITVIVVFFDSNATATAAWSRPTVSLRGGGVPIPSNILAPFSVPTELNSSY